MAARDPLHHISATIMSPDQWVCQVILIKILAFEPPIVKFSIAKNVLGDNLPNFYCFKILNYAVVVNLYMGKCGI